jgi:hypothetical protein
VTCTMQLAVPADIVPVMATADFWLAVNWNQISISTLNSG